MFTVCKALWVNSCHVYILKKKKKAKYCIDPIHLFLCSWDMLYFRRDTLNFADTCGHTVCSWKHRNCCYSWFCPRWCKSRSLLAEVLSLHECRLLPTSRTKRVSLVQVLLCFFLLHRMPYQCFPREPNCGWHFHAICRTAWKYRLRAPSENWWVLPIPDLIEHSPTASVRCPNKGDGVPICEVG